MGTLIRDGVTLFYEEAGAGKPPMLLVHGIACDHTYMVHQIEHFRRQHRVVAVDLRGHGRSDAPQQEYTIEGYTDDLAWVCAQLGLHKPVVVGHSLGGEISLALAARYPDLPRSIVMLDSGLLPPEDRLPSVRDFIERLKTSRYPEELRNYFSNLFLPGDGDELKAHILESIVKTPQPVVTSTWENGVFNYDIAAAATACRVPALYIEAGTPRTDLNHLGELYPQLTTGKTVGSGHFNQLVVPDQVNAMIERFLALTT